MLRLLFEKKGNAIWISHLDLMRLFQRAFKRAGLELVHTKGFNPRPSVSIALPLSVGVESSCELLDFDLEGDIPSLEEIRARLNRSLIPGVAVKEVYPAGRKMKELSLLDVAVTLEYDNGIPEGTVGKIQRLFSSDTLIVEKKGKNGIQNQDIIPMILSLETREQDWQTVLLEARIRCQNPTLNPALLTAAIDSYLPECHPDFSKCARTQIYDINETVFR